MDSVTARVSVLPVVGNELAAVFMGKVALDVVGWSVGPSCLRVDSEGSSERNGHEVFGTENGTTEFYVWAPQNLINILIKILFCILFNSMRVP